MIKYSLFSRYPRNCNAVDFLGINLVTIARDNLYLRQWYDSNIGTSGGGGISPAVLQDMKGPRSFQR